MLKKITAYILMVYLITIILYYVKYPREFILLFRIQYLGHPNICLQYSRKFHIRTNCTIIFKYAILHNQHSVNICPIISHYVKLLTAFIFDKAVFVMCCAVAATKRSIAL